ncbi:hypothetical protein OC846_002623 [Tilletia horrida]|uniref:RRM domain-containing protein n=1 Tax=Tilletia horrida TaxID=155126 RepID=A0AAN6JSS3_9BASI|nr:hypothetical protein OC846_002623 [Tilletia horrida]KAK0564718.1 hypothetical protein OC861_004135 [Tilletia horrida]
MQQGSQDSHAHSLGDHSQRQGQDGDHFNGAPDGGLPLDGPRRERMNSAQGIMTSMHDQYGRNQAGLQHWRSVTDNARPLRPNQQQSSPHLGEPHQNGQNTQPGPPGSSFGPLDLPFNLSPSLRFDRSRSSASDRASATSAINDSASSFGLTSDHASSRSFISPPPLPSFPEHQVQHEGDERNQLIPHFQSLGGLHDAAHFAAHLDRGFAAGLKLPPAMLGDKAALQRLQNQVNLPPAPPTGAAPIAYAGNDRNFPGRPPSVNSGWSEAQMARMMPADFPPPDAAQLQGVMARQLSVAAGPGANQEFSIFVGDLSPDLREEDLVNQFMQPPPWPPSHPFAIVHAHAQQAQGNYNPPGRIGPAPFLSTKSAKIMTDPLTGMSRGFGFVRFSHEADCARALVEMQGVVVSPANGLSPGRPLRVCTATPKNRTPNAAGPFPEQDTHPALLNAGAPLGNFPSNYNNGPPRPSAHQLGNANQPGVLGMPHMAPLQMPVLGNASGFRPGPPPGPELLRAMSPPAGHPQAGMLQQQHNLVRAAAGGPDRSSTGLAQALSQLAMPPPGIMSMAGNNGFPPQLASPPPAPTPISASSSSSALLSSSSAMDPNNTTVFVGGLSSLISEETLKTFFVPFGEITYVKIPPGKGCGFVQFVRKADAERAIERMQGFPIGGGRIRLSWGRSQGDKAAAAAAQAAAQAAQLGHLAGLAGLSGLSATQLAQLAGLSSALSAVQRNATMGNNMHAGVDPNSALLQQLANAASGLRNDPQNDFNTGGPTSPQPSQLSYGSHQHSPHAHQQVQHQGSGSGTADKFSPPDSLDLNALTALGDSRNHQQLTALLGSLTRQSGSGPAPSSNGSADTDALTATLAKISLDPHVLNRLRETTGPADSGAFGQQQSGAQGRPSPLSNLLKSSTFSPFSPAISPVVGGTTHLPAEDSNGGRHELEPHFGGDVGRIGENGPGSFNLGAFASGQGHQDDILRALMLQQQYQARYDQVGGDQTPHANRDDAALSGGSHSPVQSLEQGSRSRERGSSNSAATPLARSSGPLRSPPPPSMQSPIGNGGLPHDQLIENYSHGF